MSDATEQFQYPISETIRGFAMSLPQAEEGTSCVNRAFSAGGKNFLFVGEKEDECNVRLKLSDSIAEVESGGRFNVGKFGWTLLRFPPGDPPDAGALERWIAESFRALVPKKVAKLLDG